MKYLSICNPEMACGTLRLLGQSKIIHQSPNLNDPSVRRHIEVQARQYVLSQVIQALQRGSGGKIKITS